jgi:hypothetical protein
MKTTNSLRVRASRFFSDRFAYRERPDYLIELVAFGIIVITVTLSLANAMATTLKWTRPAYLIEGRPVSWIERI